MADKILFRQATVAALLMIILILATILLGMLLNRSSSSSPSPVTANVADINQPSSQATTTSVQLKSLGKFIATSYGPPWDAMNGTGVTSTGIALNGEACIVAVDPDVIPYHSKLVLTPHPHGDCKFYRAEDTGGAIVGRRIDIYDWRGREQQYAWGKKTINVAKIIPPNKTHFPQ